MDCDAEVERFPLTRTPVYSWFMVVISDGDAMRWLTPTPRVGVDGQRQSVDRRTTQRAVPRRAATGRVIDRDRQTVLIDDVAGAASDAWRTLAQSLGSSLTRL